MTTEYVINPASLKVLVSQIRSVKGLVKAVHEIGDALCDQYPIIKKCLDDYTEMDPKAREAFSKQVINFVKSFDLSTVESFDPELLILIIQDRIRVLETEQHKVDGAHDPDHTAEA